ncbi:Hypothetical protein TPAR_09742 [Tolypocladium paradoxum]|uniref:Uncharacterized protein n=1 Tax=Tolypocladium paradoxum TaxID=94208 RepID=A0A2S4KVX9_9HYPO|nr:Hypothetical protein TPAR_09742 [Tolypocladium paradoxum]
MEPAIYPLDILDESDPTTARGRYVQQLATTRGEILPLHLDGDDMDLARVAVIRGIRRRYEFAISDAVREVCTHRPEFARARNARLIMSNLVPGPEDMDDADKTRQPYCIWYPDFASEDTYRQVAMRFPSMRYQVGRACAAAGFVSLYTELELLPDVSIAEEAREGRTEGGGIIFETIMAAPCRYNVMDDYTLTINAENPHAPAFLNGDTDVRWRLAVRRQLPCMESDLEESRDSASGPCIEEDDRVNDEATTWPSWHQSPHILTPEEAQLLYTPLPQDLPTVKKTLLIQMAAYEGNIDRYLHCPGDIPPHHVCALLAAEVERNGPIVQRLRAHIGTFDRYSRSFYSIKRAISARRIMVNDTQEFHKAWDKDRPGPFMIWWPLRPKPDTLLEVLQKAPSMKQQVAAAAIVCDYPCLYDMVNPEPNHTLWLAARNSQNPFYLQDIKKKATEKDLLQDICSGSMMDYEPECVERELEPTGESLWSWQEGGLTTMTSHGYHYDPYGDTGAPEASPAERYVWASPSLLRKLEVFANGVTHEPTSFLEDKTLPENDQ